MLRKLVLSFTCSILLITAGTAAAQSSGDAFPSADEMPPVKYSIDQFKSKHPELYDMLDPDKFEGWVTTVQDLAARAPQDPAALKELQRMMTHPPQELLKPEVVQRFKDSLPKFTKTKEAPPKSPEAELIRAAAKAPATVLGHIQAGDVEALPNSEQLAKAREEENESLPPAPDKNYAALFDRKKDEKLPDIPKCEQDHTVTYQYSPPQGNEAAVKDILFIRAAVPSLPDELFGKRIQVYQYTGQPKDIPSRAAAVMHVPCLPFRMRVSQNVSIQDFGLNALKNYDRDFLGKGELHPYVKKNQQDLLR